MVRPRVTCNETIRSICPTYNQMSCFILLNGNVNYADIVIGRLDSKLILTDLIFSKPMKVSLTLQYLSCLMFFVFPILNTTATGKCIKDNIMCTAVHWYNTRETSYKSALIGIVEAFQ